MCAYCSSTCTYVGFCYEKEGRLNHGTRKEKKPLGGIQDFNVAAQNCLKKKAAGLAGGPCVIQSPASAALGVHDVAEQVPGLALEALKLDRLDRIVIRRARADGDAGQQQRHAEFLEARGLLHEIGARALGP